MMKRVQIDSRMTQVRAGPEHLLERNIYEETKGHLIKSVDPGSIAEELELEPGDRYLRSMEMKWKISLIMNIM